jgi:hypothetical protein
MPQNGKQAREPAGNYSLHSASSVTAKEQTAAAETEVKDAAEPCAKSPEPTTDDAMDEKKEEDEQSRAKRMRDLTDKIVLKMTGDAVLPAHVEEQVITLVRKVFQEVLEEEEEQLEKQPEKQLDEEQLKLLNRQVMKKVSLRLPSLRRLCPEMAGLRLRLEPKLLDDDDAAAAADTKLKLNWATFPDTLATEAGWPEQPAQLGRPASPGTGWPGREAEPGRPASPGTGGPGREAEPSRPASPGIGGPGRQAEPGRPASPGAASSSGRGRKPSGPEEYEKLKVSKLLYGTVPYLFCLRMITILTLFFDVLEPN